MSIQQLIEVMVDQAIEEAQYPEGFNIEEFKALRSFAERMKYARTKLPAMPKGSSRAVFSIDPVTVLKVAMNDKGLAQNKVEAEVGTGNYPTAQVFEHADDGSWLEMERAQKLNAADFTAATGATFKDFGNAVYHWHMVHERGAHKQDSSEKLRQDRRHRSFQ